MAVFFLLVGLEIKRELLAGELSSAKQATLPIVCALGGMVVPAAFYLALNVAGPGARGWGIPMATDIAFALGALNLIAPRAPIGPKVFLTALAIVDDMGPG
jgi:Na+:H+ antiporter, NhaA family